MDTEIWKDIEWYEWLYKISNFGNVYSFPKNWSWWHKWKIIIPWWSGKYLFVYLYSKWKRKSQLIHRLVAKAFIPNPDNKPFVCHKDETLVNWRLNNSADNLWWGTNSENILDCHKKWTANNHLQNNHPMKWKFWPENIKSISVLQFEKNWKFVKEWKWIHEIQRQLGIWHQNISKVCTGWRNTAWWFIWKYK